MYILRPHAAGILYAPPFYTPPTPRRVFSGVGGWGCIKFGPVKHQKFQELSGTPNHWYFLKSIAGTSGRHTAVQMGGALRYAFAFLQGIEASKAQRCKWGGRTAVQIRGVLQYFLDKLYGLWLPKQCPKLSH